MFSMKHHLCKFWMHLTDRGFFSLGLTIGLLLNFPFLIALEMIGLDTLQNIISSESLPAWASVVTASAAVYIAIKAHKLSGVQSKLSLMREISQADFETVLLLQDLRIRMASEADRLVHRMRDAGYQERDIQDAVSTLVDQEDQSEINDLISEMMSGRHEIKGDQSYDELMREWNLTQRCKTQFHCVHQLFRERSQRLNEIYLYKDTTNAARNGGTVPG